MSETDTPRTDAAIRDTWQAGTNQKVEAEFARTLERELAAMTARAEIAERQVAVLCGRLCVLIDCDIGCPARTDGCVTMCDITTAASSRAEAEKGGKG
jgi:hypothetical protein